MKTSVPDQTFSIYNPQVKVDVPDANGDTALSEAAAGGHSDAILLLLNQ